MNISEGAIQKPWEPHKEAASHGFLPGFNNVGKLARARKEIETFLRTLQISDDYVKDIDEHCPESMDLLPEDLNLSGVDIKTRQCLKRVELHIRRSGGASIPAHQDNFYHCIPNGRGVKVLVPLDELSPANGGLTFLDVKTGQQVLEHMPSNIKDFSATISPKALYEVAATHTKYIYKLGDASYHWLNSIHWAKANSTKADVMFLVYRLEEPGAAVDESMKARYESCYAQHLALQA